MQKCDFVRCLSVQCRSGKVAAFVSSSEDDAGWHTEPELADNDFPLTVTIALESGGQVEGFYRIGDVTILDEPPDVSFGRPELAHAFTDTALFLHECSDTLPNFTREDARKILYMCRSMLRTASHS